MFGMGHCWPLVGYATPLSIFDLGLKRKPFHSVPQAVEGGELILSGLQITGQPDAASGGPGLPIFARASQGAPASSQQAGITASLFPMNRG